jgi:predicted secreted Zn-dependent protease
MILSAPLGAQPAAPAQAVAAPAELSKIPGVTIKYYDVSGSTPGKILAAMRNQRPADSAGKASPSSSRWSIGIDIRKATTGTRCRVVGATAVFKAEVDFPRLAVTAKGKEEEEPGEEKLDKFLKRWHEHLATLDRQQAAYLRAIHERLPEVERAAMAGGCDGARAAAERVIARIRERSSPPAGR